MGDQAHRARRQVHREQTALGHARDQAGGVAVVDLDVDDVGVHAVEVDRESADGGDPLGEAARVAVVLGEPGDVVLERVQTRGGEHADLAHAAAEHLAQPVGLGDQLATARDHGADRRAESFGEADTHGVGASGELVRRGAAGDLGVEQARAVEVHGQAARARGRGDRAQLREGPDRAAACVVSVLDHDQARAWQVIRARADRRLELLDGEDTVFGHDRPDLSATDGRGGARLVVKRVTAGVEDDLVARSGVHAHADLVGHGAGGHEQRRLLAEALGHSLLQPVDRRVFTEDVVADLGVGHGCAHAGGGSGHGVRAQIDDVHARRPYPLSAPKPDAPRHSNRRRTKTRGESETRRFFFLSQQTAGDADT